MTSPFNRPIMLQKFAWLFVLMIAFGSDRGMGQTNVAQIKSFGYSTLSTGSEPFSRVIEGSDHLLYGTTFQGGTYNKGVLFKSSLDGTGYTVLHNFMGGNDGRGPIGELTEGKDGILYGTTFGGGPNDRGSVFKLNKDGSQYSVIRNLGGTDGAQPHAGVIEGSDGYLYGATYTGGANNFGGTAFKLSKTGDVFTVLRNFDSQNEGANNYGGVIEGLDGMLYGTLAAGGGGGNGCVWKMNKSGTGFSVLRSFYGTSGEAKSPHGRLVQSSSGVLYGTTQYGAVAAPYPDSAGLGTIFRIDGNGGNYQVLYQFPSGGLSGKSPQTALVLSTDETVLYGQTFYGGSAGKGVIFKAKTDGTSLSVIQNFTTGGGGSETTGILLASDGLLYGTKYDGGAFGQGFLYRLTTAGAGFTTLHDFTIPGGGDGAYPQASLIADGNGTFYGTTVNGGSSDEGTVFTVKEDGSGHAILHNFSSANSQGYYLYAGLLKADDGFLYGTAQYGGSGSGGTVFKMSTTGSGFAVIHQFSGGNTDGNGPISGLIQGPDGALYGTTPSGGLRNQGIVYRLTQDGTSFSILHSFAGGSLDGSNPQSKLLLGKDGVFYGTTRDGGPVAGTVYKINPNGTGFSMLHGFLGNQDAAFPQGELIQGTDNLLYGTTANGGPADGGAIFKVSTNGTTYSVLYQFTGANGDGRQPSGGLVQATNGVLYGSTTYGGLPSDGGILFKINTDGTAYAQLYKFSGNGIDGGSPLSTLTKGTTDALFGTIQNGGQMGFGNIFKLYTPIIRFSGIKKVSGGWSLNFIEGNPAIQYNIQGSPNPADPNSWQSVGLGMPQTDGTMQFTDPATNLPLRFYRTTTTLPR